MRTNNTIAFLPGFGFKASIWQDIASQFPDNKVLFIDFPPAQDNIISVINDHIPEHAILIAWSLGGNIAIELCLQFPNKYSKLITVASTPKWIDDNEWPGISKEMMDSFYHNAITNLPKLLLKFQQLVNGKNREVQYRKWMASHAMDATQPASLLFYLRLLME